MLSPRHQIVKKALTGAAAVTLLTAGAVTVEIKQVKQRFPWNGLVDIDYEIKDSEGLKLANDKLEFRAINHATDPETANVMYWIDPIPTTLAAGTYRVTWNANADGVTYKSSDVTVEVAIRRYVPKYLVIDISSGPDAESYSYEYLDREPVGGFNVETYKGDKIVFRQIPPGSFMMGSPTTEIGREPSGNCVKETLHPVAITRPFYIGVFEVTQAQYANIMGVAADSDAEKYRPKVSLNYESICTASDNIIRRLSSKTGLSFALPYEAQWEYACRAGTTTPFCTGAEVSTDAQLLAEFRKVGVCISNPSDSDFGSGTATVGHFLPNDYGLYDMHGNAEEWCEDLRSEDPANLGQRIDPTGSTSGSHSTRRGGSTNQDYKSCRSAQRNDPWPDDAYGFRGCRLVVNP